jgi:hypothetical protein
MSKNWIKEESWCNIGNVKLYAIFERRYGRMWQENGGNGRHAGAEKYDFVVSKWHEYLKDMGLDLVENKPQTSEHIMNPSSKMGQYRNWPSYISIPEELALKILVLGELP